MDDDLSHGFLTILLQFEDTEGCMFASDSPESPQARRAQKEADDPGGASAAP